MYHVITGSLRRRLPTSGEGGRRRPAGYLLAWIALGLSCANTWSYSLLTHEEVVDIMWREQICKLLLQRFPAATEAQLREAHAYAYGGCLIQDIGYYPFGDKLFSELTHYVRTGEFVANLIRESADLDEYAFALGALAHYSSDITGHPPINHAVALTFPKLRAKFGETVTYEEDPRAHIQTEFGFDITQVAKNRYTSDRYHDFIGFGVSKQVLERAFLRTYGLQLEQVLGHVDLAIGTFRRAVSQVIPEMTRAALVAYHPEIVRDTPNFNKQQFLYNLSRAQYETQWGKQYRKPGLVARLLAFFVKWVPKFGFLEALAFRIPTSQTEDLYLHSVNVTVADYQKRLGELANGRLDFPDIDCDTGHRTTRGEYLLADQTYRQLLELLLKQGLTSMQPDLQANILAFYAEPRVKPTAHLTARRRHHRVELAEELAALRAGPGSELAMQVQHRLLAPPFKLESPKAKDI